jgi:hypothetical protein
VKTIRRYGYHEAARINPCPSCHSHVLSGRLNGAAVTADPVNISIAGELAARIQKRSTYDLRSGGYPPRLYFRFRGLADIQAIRKYAVVADHKCGCELPSQPSPPYDGLLSVARITLPDKPPF